MKKKALSLLVGLVVFIGLIGFSHAQIPASGPRITYGGMLLQLWPGGILVKVDTGIFVFNPNNHPISGVGIAVFDKYGNALADTKLYNGDAETDTIPTKGWLWTTLGVVLIDQPVAMERAAKFTFVVYWTKAKGHPDRGLVAEIKEVIYRDYFYPKDIFMLDDSVQTWSETSLGKGGVGYSNR